MRDRAEGFASPHPINYRTPFLCPHHLPRKKGFYGRQTPEHLHDALWLRRNALHDGAGTDRTRNCVTGSYHIVGQILNTL